MSILPARVASVPRPGGNGSGRTSPNSGPSSLEPLMIRQGCTVSRIRGTNGRLEHLRGIALGFRNLVNYRLRSLLEAGGFRPLIHSLS